MDSCGNVGNWSPGLRTSHTGRASCVCWMCLWIPFCFDHVFLKIHWHLKWTDGPVTIIFLICYEKQCPFLFAERKDTIDQAQRSSESRRHHSILCATIAHNKWRHRTVQERGENYTLWDQVTMCQVFLRLNLISPSWTNSLYLRGRYLANPKFYFVTIYSEGP
jgi:hypothetical protein